MMLNKNGKKIVILGITGPTGAGKTTISEILNKKGIEIIDTDKLARGITEPGKPALAELAEHFGEVILNPDGTLFRKKLAELAFSDKEELKVLNRITHKYIGMETEKRILEYCGDILGIDGAVLIGSGIDEKCDKILSVLADKKTRKKRIMLRDGISEEEANKRMSSQSDDKFYIENSDYLVYTDNEEDNGRKLDEIIKELRSMM